MATLQLESGHIRVVERDALLHVTLARPDKLNALTQAMYIDLARAAAHVAERNDIHALLLDGEGRSFCAGNDIKAFVDAEPQDGGRGGANAAMAFVRRLMALDKPIIMAVHGNAAGIGTTLLLHSDLVIAADSARFQTAFINLGVTPEAGSSLLLPQLLGRQNAARLLLAGDRFDADEAQRMGLVAYRCRDDELETKALALSQTLAAKPPQAMQATKRLLRHGTQVIEARIDEELDRFAEHMVSSEAKAAFAKFLGKGA